MQTIQLLKTGQRHRHSHGTRINDSDVVNLEQVAGVSSYDVYFKDDYIGIVEKVNSRWYSFLEDEVDPGKGFTSRKSAIIDLIGRFQTNDELYVLLGNRIEKAGVRYALCDYSDWSDIKDREFQNARQRYLELNKELKELEDHFQMISGAAYQG